MHHGLEAVFSLVRKHVAPLMAAICDTAVLSLKEHKTLFAQNVQRFHHLQRFYHLMDGSDARCAPI